MTLPLITHADAQAEYDDSVDWYERRQSGLGMRFLRAVRSRLDVIVADPLRYAVVHRDIREAEVPDFPFVIYYVALPSHVWVLSVFHTSQNPIIWKQRRSRP